MAYLLVRRSSFRLAGWCGLGCLGLTLATFSARAQDASSAKPDIKPTPQAPKMDKFMTDDLMKVTRLDVSTQEMRTYLKGMRALAIRYHLSEELSETRSLGAEWRRGLSGGHRIHDQMIRAALGDFQEDPDLESKAGKFLMFITGRNADFDRFDNMFEVVDLLKQHKAQGKSFDLCYGLTAVANNQFTAAKPHLEVAAKNLELSAQDFAKEAKQLSEDERKLVQQKLIQTFEMVADYMQTDMYEKLWQAELKAREEDAAGEPLPQVLIETSKGDVKIELFENNAPNTVANFIELCEKGFYNGTPFHRVLTHFMAQGGDPTGTGQGGPGYAIATELNDKSRNFFRGTLGMALSGLPDSGGSQFFICYMPRNNLNGKYVAFGRVIEGMNIVSDLCHIDPDNKEAEHSTQDFPDGIISVRVISKRNHEYKATKLPDPTAAPRAR